MKILNAKLDKLDERLDSVDKTLIKQEANLAEHIRRTELAELSIQDLRDTVEPIKTKMNMAEGAIKLLGLISLGVSIAVGAAQMLGFVKSLF